MVGAARKRVLAERRSPTADNERATSDEPCRRPTAAADSLRGVGAERGGAAAGDAADGAACVDGRAGCVDGRRPRAEPWIVRAADELVADAAERTRRSGRRLATQDVAPRRVADARRPSWPSARVAPDVRAVRCTGATASACAATAAARRGAAGGCRDGATGCGAGSRRGGARRLPAAVAGTAERRRRRRSRRRDRHRRGSHGHRLDGATATVQAAAGARARDAAAATADRRSRSSSLRHADAEMDVRHVELGRRRSARSSRRRRPRRQLRPSRSAERAEMRQRDRVAVGRSGSLSVRPLPGVVPDERDDAAGRRDDRAAGSPPMSMPRCWPAAYGCARSNEKVRSTAPAAGHDHARGARHARTSASEQHERARAATVTPRCQIEKTEWRTVAAAARHVVKFAYRERLIERVREAPVSRATSSAACRARQAGARRAPHSLGAGGLVHARRSARAEDEH